MDISLDVAWNIGTIVFAGAICWTITKRCAEDIQEIWKVITKRRDWELAHDRDAAEKRIEIERRISEVAAEAGRYQAMCQAQNMETNRRLEGIDKKLDRIIESRNQ